LAGISINITGSCIRKSKNTKENQRRKQLREREPEKIWPRDFCALK
jgi:hypothetical protein